VQGSHLVEERGLDQLHAGLKQLGTNDHGKKAAQQKHRKRKPQVHGSNIFVVSGKKPPTKALGRTVMMLAHR
jgi:hypothetical protein